VRNNSNTMRLLQKLISQNPTRKIYYNCSLFGHNGFCQNFAFRQQHVRALSKKVTLICEGNFICGKRNHQQLRGDDKK